MDGVLEEASVPDRVHGGLQDAGAAGVSGAGAERHRHRALRQPAADHGRGVLLVLGAPAGGQAAGQGAGPLAEGVSAGG